MMIFSTSILKKLHLLKRDFIFYGKLFLEAPQGQYIQNIGTMARCWLFLNENIIFLE
jgi:hypothetical protein